MSNTYQKTSRHAQAGPVPVEVAVPEQVIVSMAEVAESAKEGPLALAVGTGLRCSPRTLSGCAGRVPARRRGRPGDAGRAAPASDPAPGAGHRRVRELRLPSYDLFSGTEILGKLALEKMLGRACRRAATSMGWSPPGPGWPTRRPRRASRRSRAGPRRSHGGWRGR